MAISTVPASSLKETTSQEDSSPHSAEVDTIALAREAVKAGLIKQDVLDHLISLSPQVPSSMKYRYLLMQLRETVGANINDEQFFARMVQVLVEFQPDKKNAEENINMPFGHEHIPELVEFLAKYAYKWELIGTALKFQPHDLSNIEANNVSRRDFVMRNLISLLEEWIGKKYKHTLPPTMGYLKRALNSQMVGLGALACELGKMFVAPQDKTSKTLPYLVVSVDIQETREDTVTFLSTYSQNMNVHAKENGSVLLEMQCTCDRETTLQYQWRQNKIPIQESAVHTGTTTPVLCISNADIDMDSSKYQCTTIASSLSVFNTKKITLRVDCPLDVYTHCLAAMYTAQPEVPRDTWPPVSSKKYINLALIRQEQVNYGAQYAHLTIRGDIDDVLQHKEVIEYDQVFKSLRCGQVIFIEGRPGSGKTTFVHKITRDWAITRNGGAMRLVLLVSLRVLNNLYKYNRIELSDILNLFMDLKVSKELIEERKGKGICFIFDGLDEFLPPDGENSIVHRIIHKTYLSQSTVIVASRPAAIAELRQIANKVIEVVGFKKEQIYEYFDHYPFSKQSKSAELKAYLSTHLNILHMCYLPVHAAMVGFLFEVSGEVPQTETEIYRHFTHLTLKRNLTKSGSANIDVHNLSGEEEIIFNQICKLALNKTVLNKQVMLQDEVTWLLNSEKDKDMSLGLITIDRTADLYGFKNLYTFLHLTFQEYLAAHHISTLSDEEQDKLIQEHGNKNHMLAVWKFYCGLVKFNVRFKSILESTFGKHLFHIQCAYESQQQLTCTQLLKSKKYHIQLADQYLTTPDFTAMGYIMNKSVLPVTLSLKNCKINIEAIDAMLLQITSERRSLLQTLYFESRDADMECVKRLLINTKSLKKLTLYRSNCKALAGIQALADGLKKCTELKELDISNNGIRDGKTLATGLTSCRNLERICIRDNGLSSDGVRAIFKEIGPSILKLNSQDIIIGNNNITNHDFIAILQHCTKLKELNISGSCIWDGKTLATGLTSCRNLERICIRDNGLSSDGVRDIFKEIGSYKLKLYYQDIIVGNKITSNEFIGIVQNCINLQSLEIEMEFEQFLSCSRCWKTLTELKVYFIHCALDTQKTIDEISSCLQNFSKLQKVSLHMGNYELSHRGAESLAEGLSYCPDLQVLNLTIIKCTLTTCNILKYCTSLKELSLNHGIELCEAIRLSSCPNLEVLKVRNSYMTVLTTNFGNCTQLNQLHLGHNSLNDINVKTLAANLYYFPQLKGLNLCDNEIGDDGAKVLAVNLHHCTQLIQINLSGNRIGDNGAKVLADNIHHCTQLKVLDLRKNAISIHVAKALAAKFHKLILE